MVNVRRGKEILTTGLKGLVEGERRRGRKSLTMIHKVKRGGYKKTQGETWDGAIRENSGERNLPIGRPPKKSAVR